MKNNKGIFFLAFLSLTLLSFSACSGKSKERSMEAAFPKESAIVMEVDFTNDGQAANFNKLIEAFPTTGFGKLVKNAFDARLPEADVLWDRDIAPIFKGKWKVGVARGEGVALRDDYSEDYFAMQVSDGKKVSVFLNKLQKIGSWKNVKYEKDGGVEYWTRDFGDIYLALDGNVLVAAKNKKNLEAALARLSGDDGFDSSTMIGDGFFRYYLKSPFLDEKSIDLFAEAFGRRLVNLIEGVQVDAGSISAGEDGFEFAEIITHILKKEELKKLDIDADRKLSLINKVNGDGLFYYYEGGSFKAGFMGSIIWDTVEGSDVPDGEALGFFRAKTRPFVQRFDVLFRSPYAVSISDKESFLPAIAIYFQLEEGDMEEAKMLLNDFDGYFDQLLKQVNPFMRAAGEIEYFKKDVVALNGVALHKFYVDWEAVPQEEITRWSDELGIDVTTLKNEIYYGLMEDNVFVLAWYPDFTSEYGKNPLAQNKDYLEAVKKLGDTYGSSVAYVNTTSFLKFTDRFVQVWKGALSGFEAAQMESMYELYFRKLVGTVRYFIGSGLYTEGKISGRAFVRIEKVEEK